MCAHRGQMRRCFSQKKGVLMTSAAAAVLLFDLRLSCFLCLDFEECGLEEVDLELLLE